LCDVGRVAVKHSLKVLSFLHLYLLFYYNLLTVLDYIWSKYRRVQRLRSPTKGLKLWRFDHTLSESWAYFSLRMRRNAYLRASGQKSDSAVRFGDPDFL